MKWISILALAQFIFGSATIANPDPPYSRVVGYATRDVPSGCGLLAHSKLHNKLVMSCLETDGSGYTIHIISTDSGTENIIKNTRLDVFPKPYVFQTERQLFLYFVGGDHNPNIRQLDALRGTITDRPLRMPSDGNYTGAYLNPIAGCLIISRGFATGKFSAVEKLEVYSYDPLSLAPIEVDQAPDLSVTGPDFQLFGAHSTGSFATCTRSKDNKLALYLSSKARDTPGAGGAYLKRITANGADILAESQSDFRFLQQKSRGKIYAVNKNEAYVAELDVETGALAKLGTTAAGNWSDYDPLRRVGLLSRPGPNNPNVNRVCFASVDSGRCVDQEYILRNHPQNWFPNASAGALEDGLIFRSEKDGLSHWY